MGVPLDDRQLNQLDLFALLLIEKNRGLNLTRITEPSDIVTLHYLDSLACAVVADLTPGAAVVDVGTGAGFPGIPLKIARPDLHLTLVDSSRKKLLFIEQACEALGLTDVVLVHARAEEAGRDPAHRERYDIALSRAVADLKALAELCLPLVVVGGQLVAQKSVDIEEELAQARPIIGQLGGKIEKDIAVALPGSDVIRRLVSISKTRSTPPQFPRKFSRISRG